MRVYVFVEGVSTLVLLFILHFVRRNAFSETPISWSVSNAGSCVEVQKPAAFQLCRAGLCFDGSVATLRVRLLFQKAKCHSLTETVK